MKKGKKKYKFVPEFKPSVIEVILDEGVEKAEGFLVRLPIVDVQYSTNFLRITVRDYRRTK